MRFQRLLLAACALLLQSLPAMGAELLISFDEAHPPYMFKNEGQAAGVYPAIIKAAFGRMNVAVRLEPKPWARAIDEIEGNLAGVGGIYKNAERLRKYDYSEPLLVETITVYFHRDRPLGFRQVEDLQGRRIGVMRGWSYGDAFDRARRAGVFTVESVSTDEQNFLKLQSGRVDAVLAIGESVARLLEAYPDLRPSEVPLVQAPAYLAFSKAASRAGLLMQFDQAVRDMKASGEFQAIVAAELGE